MRISSKIRCKRKITALLQPIKGVTLKETASASSPKGEIDSTLDVPANDQKKISITLLRILRNPNASKMKAFWNLI